MQVQIAEAGALSGLLGVLESGSAACREAGAWLLSNLACCSEVSSGARDWEGKVVGGVVRAGPFGIHRLAGCHSVMSPIVLPALPWDRVARAL